MSSSFCAAGWSSCLELLVPAVVGGGGGSSGVGVVKHHGCLGLFKSGLVSAGLLQRLLPDSLWGGRGCCLDESCLSELSGVGDSGPAVCVLLLEGVYMYGKGFHRVMAACRGSDGLLNVNVWAPLRDGVYTRAEVMLEFGLLSYGDMVSAAAAPHRVLTCLDSLSVACDILWLARKRHGVNTFLSTIMNECGLSSNTALFYAADALKSGARDLLFKQGHVLHGAGGWARAYHHDPAFKSLSDAGQCGVVRRLIEKKEGGEEMPSACDFPAICSNVCGGGDGPLDGGEEEMSLVSTPRPPPPFSSLYYHLFTNKCSSTSLHHRTTCSKQRNWALCFPSFTGTGRVVGLTHRLPRGKSRR
jgi:hypothetical protein